nr:EAL domain-containing protein [Propylenella binzhouense]
MAGFTYRARQLVQENEAIRFLALHDELTGLANRKRFEEFLTEAMPRDQAAGRKTALFMIDLDGFKNINDTLGHQVGDSVLQAAAKRLKGSVRGDDLVVRISGDEFALVVPGISQSSLLAVIAERVLALLCAPFRVDGQEVLIGCSIGVAVAPENGTDIETLSRNADFALYRAKSDGKRTWRFFDPKMAEDLAARRMLERGLREALVQGSFDLVYQPQVELATGAVTGYEAMIRWRLPDGRLVPAAEFVPIAEETGLVIPIGEWVIRQAAEDCGRMPLGRRISLNLSAAQLKREGIDAFIRDTFQEAGFDPARIEIEVNEGILGRNEAIAFDRLRRMRGYGMKVVMESFGVGTLSLGLLSRYPFDKVKLDKMFLSNVREDRQSDAVLGAICSLCRSLGMEVAGSGVETKEQVGILRAAGCSEAQGYYFARPMSLDELVEAEEAEIEADAQRHGRAIA